MLTSKQRATLRLNVSRLADKAQWKHFISHYYRAYDFALRAAQQ